MLLPIRRIIAVGKNPFVQQRIVDNKEEFVRVRFGPRVQIVNEFNRI